MIFPNQKWVISFDTNVFNIINDFEEKTVRIGYEYCKYGKNKSYIEKIAIDFSEYSGFLNYISEVDEFKNSVDNLRKSMENIDKGIKKLICSNRRWRKLWIRMRLKNFDCLGKNRADRRVSLKGVEYGITEDNIEDVNADSVGEKSSLPNENETASGSDCRD